METKEDYLFSLDWIVKGREGKKNIRNQSKQKFSLFCFYSFNIRNENQWKKNTDTCSKKQSERFVLVMHK